MQQIVQSIDVEIEREFEVDENATTSALIDRMQEIINEV
jgi:hypothetical protein